MIFGIACVFATVQLGFVVSLSLFTVIIFAAVLGTIIPLLLNKYKIDPALATGPFITTLNDVIGLFIYFYIGKILTKLSSEKEKASLEERASLISQAKEIVDSNIIELQKELRQVRHQKEELSTLNIRQDSELINLHQKLTEQKKETEFSEKIDELNQETDTLLEEIDKWQM